MRTIIEYLETEFATFDEKPFNAVDSLVLSQFSMARVEGIVPPLRNASALESVGARLRGKLPRAAFRSSRNAGARFGDVLLAERFEDVIGSAAPSPMRNLLFALAASPRFRDMRICEYATVFNEREATQFAALSFVHGDAFAYVAFRGTDGSLTGWREDFNMAYMHPVPSQMQAVRYIEAVAPRMPSRLLVGGHSKGGNLAAYAGTKASPGVCARIERVFNHDGPGFMPGALSPDEEAALRTLVDKTVPQESVVGMLLDDPARHRVVHSSGRGVKQHIPFTWEVNAEGIDFVEHDGGLTAATAFADGVIGEWLSRYNERDARVIVDALFEVMASTGVEDFTEFFQGGVKTIAVLTDAAAKAPARREMCLRGPSHRFRKSR